MTTIELIKELRIRAMQREFARGGPIRKEASDELHETVLALGARLGEEAKNAIKNYVWWAARLDNHCFTRSDERWEAFDNLCGAHDDLMKFVKE